MFYLKSVELGRKRRSLPLLENVEIIDVAAEGKSIAKVDDIIVFVTNVVPGDIVDVQINRKRSSFKEGYPVKFHKYSDIRTEPICEHFGVCGGCKWQNLPYEKQLEYKQKQVVDNLERIGKIKLPEMNNILASENTSYYRNKLEYTFSNRKWLTTEEIGIEDEDRQMNALGFHIPKMFDKIVDVNHCHLQKDPSNAIRLEFRKYALENNLTFFDLRNQEGFLRTLIIRTSSTNELMVIPVFFYEDVEKREGLLNHIADKFPEISSLMYVINTKANDTIADQEIELFKGNDHFYEEMEGLKFKIGPKSFYQTNSEQAYNLYKITRDFAELDKDKTVYDLYTGTGTIANFVARDCKNVVGVEYIPEAIEDAKLNSEINNITNTSFYAGDMKDVLTQEFIDQNGRPDVMIVDPPRAGMHPNVVKAILYANADRIVYVSCNPATQARDINLMEEHYKVTKVQAVDMFPHTHHVENVVLLEKIS